MLTGWLDTYRGRIHRNCRIFCRWVYQLNSSAGRRVVVVGRRRRGAMGRQRGGSGHAKGI
jgi:hypothetical protein